MCQQRLFSRCFHVDSENSSMMNSSMLKLVVLSCTLAACTSPTLSTSNIVANNIPNIPEKLEVKSVTSLVIPVKPVAVITTIDNKKNACFDSNGVTVLNQIYTIAEANTQILDTLSTANTKIVGAHNYLVDLVALQEQKIQFLQQSLDRSEATRIEEQRNNEIWDTVTKVLLGVLAVFR